MRVRCDSESGRLRRVALAAPEFYRQTTPINRRQERESAGRPVDRDVLLAEHGRLRRALKDEGVDVVDIDPHPEMPYLLNIRDAAVVVDSALMPCVMGEPLRRDEPSWVVEQLGGTRLGSSAQEEEWSIEGGDVFQVGGALLVGISQRTTAKGVVSYLAATGKEAYPVELADGVLHLDTAFNVVDHLALVAEGAIRDPASLRAQLSRLGVLEIVDLDPEDADELGANFLCLDEQRVLIAETCEGVREALRGRGIDSVGVPMSEHHRVGGSVRCATLVLERDPVASRQPCSRSRHAE